LSLLEDFQDEWESARGDGQMMMCLVKGLSQETQNYNTESLKSTKSFFDRLTWLFYENTSKYVNSRYNMPTNQFLLLFGATG